MSGGYVQYNGKRSPLKNSPRGSKNEYIFTPGVFIQVKDKADFKFYEWRASRSDIQPNGRKTWVAKKRLAKDDVSRESQRAERKLVDKKDPNFDAGARLREVEQKRKELDEMTRKYFGKSLPNYLKESKGLKKKSIPQKDGDE